MVITLSPPCHKIGTDGALWPANRVPLGKLQFIDEKSGNVCVISPFYVLLCVLRSLLQPFEFTQFVRCSEKSSPCVRKLTSGETDSEPPDQACSLNTSSWPLPLDPGDAALAYLEQGMAAWNEAEVDIRDRLAVHAHGTLADQPARLARGRD